MYAKNKEVMNVTATGTANDPGLSGTNGFELKKLPEIQWGDISKKQKIEKFTTQDIRAAALRRSLRTGEIIDGQFIKEQSGKLIKAEIDSGVVNRDRYRLFSGSLLIENTLYDSQSKPDTLNFGVNLSDEEQKVIDTVDPIYSNMRILADLINRIKTLTEDGVSVNDIKEALQNPAKYNDPELNNIVRLAREKNLASELDECINQMNDGNERLDTDELDDLERILTEMKIKANPRRATLTQETIGYRIRNIGSQAIPITRMTTTDDHSKSETVLNPGQVMSLNRAELALLAAKPEVNFTFANGKLVASSRNIGSSWEALSTFYFVFERSKLDVSDAHRYELQDSISSVSAYSEASRLDVRKVESPEVIAKYFSRGSAAVTRKRVQPQTKAQAKQNIQQKGLFNGFKR